MRRGLVASMCALVVAAAACSSSSHSKAASPGGTGLDVKVVSSRPDMVVGDAALLAIANGTGTPTVSVNNKALNIAPLKQWWSVEGIPLGPSTLVVNRGGESATVP